MYGTSSLRPSARAARKCSSIRAMSDVGLGADWFARSRTRWAHIADWFARSRTRSAHIADQLHRLSDVLVAAAGEAHEHGPALQVRRLADEPGDGVRRLEGAEDALGAGQERERVEHLGIRDRRVLGPPDRGEVRVLGADARVVEAGRDGVRLLDLPVLVLHQVAA